MLAVEAAAGGDHGDDATQSAEAGEPGGGGEVETGFMKDDNKDAPFRGEM